MQELVQLNNAFKHIRYFDDEHKYIDTTTGQELISCTTLIKKYQQQFQKDFWLKKKAKEYGTEPETLDEQWTKDAVIGTTRGSMLHKYLENLLSGKEFPIEYPKFVHSLPSHEFITFHKSFERLKEFGNSFAEDFSYLVPVKLEAVLGDSELGVAGQCDALFYDPVENEFVLLDFKTDKKISVHNKYQNFKKPLTHLSQCEINKYSLQLSIYKYLIEKNTDVKINKMIIVWFNHKNDGYELFPINYLENEVNLILN